MKAFFKTYWWQLICTFSAIFILWFPVEAMEVIINVAKLIGLGDTLSGPSAGFAFAQVYFVAIGLLISATKMILHLLWSGIKRLFRKKR